MRNVLRIQKIYIFAARLKSIKALKLNIKRIGYRKDIYFLNLLTPNRKEHIMNWNALSDNELIARYQAGEEVALKTIILRYERRLFSYLMVSVRNKELAEDIFQDTFIKVINTIRSGNYHEEGKFFQWIMRIANNLKIRFQFF